MFQYDKTPFEKGYRDALYSRDEAALGSGDQYDAYMRGQQAAKDPIIMEKLNECLRRTAA